MQQFNRSFGLVWARRSSSDSIVLIGLRRMHLWRCMTAQARLSGPKWEPFINRPFGFTIEAMIDCHLQTERLMMRRWIASDHAPFAEMCVDPEVMRFIGNGSTMDHDQVARDLADYEAFWNANGFGQFAIELKQTGQFIGFAGLGSHLLLPEYASFTEIGWRLARHAWGKGYATEAAKAVMGFAVDNDRIFEIVSVCQIENTASRNIMRKIGLTLDRVGTAPNNGRLIEIFTSNKV